MTDAGSLAYRVETTPFITGTVSKGAFAKANSVLPRGTSNTSLVNQTFTSGRDIAKRFQNDPHAHVKITRLWEKDLTGATNKETRVL